MKRSSNPPQSVWPFGPREKTPQEIDRERRELGERRRLEALQRGRQAQAKRKKVEA